MEGLEHWTTQADRVLQQLKEQSEHSYLQQVTPVRIYAAVVIVLLTFFFHLSGRLFKRLKAKTLLLTGLSGSGKTVLFHQLRDGSSHQGTVTSMEPNEGKSKNGKIKPVHLVDIPGHSRLRHKLDEFLPPSSWYLYDILTKATVVNKKIPVLILCNKTDKMTAHSKDFIRKQLEKELDKLRASRSAISTADIANYFTLGVLGEPFSFLQCQTKVKIAEGAGITGNISQVEQFIREHVKS